MDQEYGKLDTIGKRIAYVRGFQSKVKLARILECSSPTILRYEKDINPPSLEFVDAFCLHYKIRPEWLMFGTGTAPDEENLRRALLDKKFDQLDTIGKRIAYVRGDQSKVKLARILECSSPTILRYEKDINPPSLEFVDAFCHYYRIRTEWLMYGAGDPWKSMNNKTVGHELDKCQNRALQHEDLDYSTPEFLIEAGGPFIYYPDLANITGAKECVFLCLLIHYNGKQADSDGWIYKTVDEITNETGLSYREQVTARHKLKRINLLEEKEDRLSHKKYYRVNLSSLGALEADTQKRRDIENIVSEKEERHYVGLLEQ